MREGDVTLTGAPSPSVGVKPPLKQPPQSQHMLAPNWPALFPGHRRLRVAHVSIPGTAVATLLWEQERMFVLASGSASCRSLYSTPSSAAEHTKLTGLAALTVLVLLRELGAACLTRTPWPGTFGPRRDGSSPAMITVEPDLAQHPQASSLLLHMVMFSSF